MGNAEQFLVEILSGRGNLDARALWAAVVGRYRLAFGEKRSKVVSLSEGSTLVARNIGSAGVYQMVGVSLQAGAPIDPVVMAFSSQALTGTNTGIPVRLTSAMGAQDSGNLATGGGSFMSVLQPGEELYAILPQGGPASARIVVSQVTF